MAAIINSALDDPASVLNGTATQPLANKTTQPTGIINSALTAAPTPTTAPSVAPTPAPTAAPDYTGQLTGLYQSELGRAPDATGMDFWKTQMANGITADQVKRAMDASDEYKAAHSAPTGSPTGAPIIGQLPAASYTAAQLGTPTAWNITPEQTVAGQIKGILDANSPIIQQARTQGLQLANERGLLNSSIGESAGLDAAYSAAMPIAQADAATHARAAGYNADEANQFSVFNANAKNQASQAGLSAQVQQNIAQLQAQTNTNLAYLDASTKTNLANLSNQNQVQLANIEAQYHQLMQANQSASNLFSQVTQNIATISASKDMDAAAKQTAVDNQLQLLKSGMQINGAMSNLNLGDLLDFGSQTPAPSAAPTGIINNAVVAP